MTAHHTTSTTGLPTAVEAGLAGPSARTVAAGTGTGKSAAGGILMTLGGMLLAGGAIATLRRHGRHAR